MALITYSDKSIGDQFTAAEATEIKNVVNTNFGFHSPSVDSLGGYNDGITDNFSIIQGAIDANETIVIGQGLSDVYLISQPLYLNANNNIIINGIVKIQDANIRDLTADAPSGQDYVDVANASTYFSVGQWLSVSDEDMGMSGGGVNRDHLISNALRVSAVTSTRVTFEANLEYSFTTASNAKIGHLQSCFICKQIDDWSISGKGEIDNNGLNQYNVTPVRTSELGFAEAVECGVCITAISCDRFNIDGLTIRNGGLHNMNLRICKDYTIQNIRSYDTHDKHMITWDSDRGKYFNLYANTSRYEDGFTWYSNNDGMQLDNIYAIGCPRSGIHFVSNNRNFVGNNLQSEGNGINMTIADSYRMALSNINIFDSASGVVITGGIDITLNNIMIDCSHAAHQYAFSISYQPKNVVINGGQIVDSAGTTGNGYGINCDQTASQYPDQIFVNNVVFKDMRIPVRTVTGSTNIYYNNCVFINPTVALNKTNATFHNEVEI